MRQLLLFAIRAYQRYLSPHKGYCCAYRAYTSRASCSALGLRAVQIYGAHAGLIILRKRLYRCGVAQRRYGPTKSRDSLNARPHIKQRGDCDPGCSGCDSFDLPFDKASVGKMEWLDCLDCASCDWPSKKNKNRAQERTVHIPPLVRKE